MTEIQDPFVLAVREIVANPRAKYFFEWLVQSRIDVSSSVAEAGDSVKLMKISGAVAVLDGILRDIAAAAEKSNISADLQVSVSGILANGNLAYGRDAARTAQSSEPQHQKI